MEIEVKERLINLVRENECMYDQKHKDYKNNSYKVQLWENIGAELNIEVNEAKQMWQTLRDGYTRHRKQVKWQKGYSRKYTHYMWSAHMTFLDSTLDARSFGPESRVMKPPVTQVNQLIQPSQPSTKLQNSPGLPNAKFSKRKESNKKEGYTTKKKREDDGIDHLFRSYAETFKTFSLRKQAELKIVLAKTFAEAELSELDNDIRQTSVDQDNAAPAFYFSTEELSEDGIKREDVSDDE